MIHRIRIDYDKPHAPGLFVIRGGADGEIRGENRNLAYRQQKHGAGITQAPPATTRRISKKRASEIHKTIKKCPAGAQPTEQKNTRKDTTQVYHGRRHKSMADRKTRWQKADENFRFQVKVLMAKSGLSVSKIGSRCNVSHTTMYHYMNCPAEMPKRIERYLTLLFEEHGLRYDPTLGERAGA